LIHTAKSSSKYFPIIQIPQKKAIFKKENSATIFLFPNHQKIYSITMKFLFLLLIAVVTLTLTGCGTIGGTLSGAGHDLSAAGDWIKTINQ
jgi:predicted small secreted protein